MIGALNALLVLMKGLAMTYFKDMQEDKEPVFEVADTLALTVPAMTGMITDMTVNPDAMADAAGDGFATATDLADWLVRALGLPFREAHHVTGALVKMAEDHEVDLADLPLGRMQEVEPRITIDVFEVLTVQRSVASRTSYGGTAPDNVREAVKRLRGELA